MRYRPSSTRPVRLPCMAVLGGSARPATVSRAVPLSATTTSLLPSRVQKRASSSYVLPHVGQRFIASALRQQRLHAAPFYVPAAQHGHGAPTRHDQPLQKGSHGDRATRL